MSSNLRIGFLGTGKMATALGKGLLQAKLLEANSIFGFDSAEVARAAFSRQVGANLLGSNMEVLEQAQVLILAVKPENVPAVLKEVTAGFTQAHLLISVAAGITLDRLESLLPDKARIVRVMPNTPALVGYSATAFALGKYALPEDGYLARQIFSAVGIAFEVKEALLDAVTGLSGSGPAYVYLFIEALSDGGVAAGLPREVATQLAAQTVLGSAKMALETGLHPATLRDMVTSPGGTTIEGLHEMEKAGVRGAVMSAVRAASEKAKKLGQT